MDISARDCPLLKGSHLDFRYFQRLRTRENPDVTYIHYDFKNNHHKIFELAQTQITSEPVFVPRTKTSAEGDGFILSVIYDARRDTSDLYIFDAQNIDKAPLAIVQMPHRIPMGFHGNWYQY